MAKISKTRYYSYKIGKLSKGCQLCVNGFKSVLFITGLCSSHCYYCPISDQKRNKDVIYINEWHTDKIKDVIKEISLCSSKGIGITGGDPLVKIDRVCHFIKELKKRFGSKFHVHLYTPLDLVNKENLAKLYISGLDEIRFHPSLDKIDIKAWNKIRLAEQFNWDIGVEIPAIPGKSPIIRRLIVFLSSTRTKFFNINELEISDTNASDLLEKGFKPKDNVSYGVKGSERLAMRMLEYCKHKNVKFNVHYCTTTLKDKVQLAKRIMRRAKSVAKDFDKITKDGMLVRGAIYCKELFPSFGYNRKVENLSLTKRNKLLKKLKEVNMILINRFRLKSSDCYLDESRLRLLTSKSTVIKLSDFLKSIKLMPAIVEEYPTYDNLIVNLEFI